MSCHYLAHKYGHIAERLQDFFGIVIAFTAQRQELDLCYLTSHTYKSQAPSAMLLTISFAKGYSAIQN